MDYRARSEFNKQVHEEACAWFVECRSGELDPNARREFDRWLRKSPEHLSAYLEIAAIWNEGPALDAQQRWDSAALIAAALEDRGNVIALPEPARGEAPAAPVDTLTAAPVQPTAGSATVFAARTRRLLAAAAAIAFLTLGTLLWSQLFRVPTYATGVGEQRSIMLADGSTVDLNSRSKIKVRYSKRARAVDLVAGQALFRVVKDAARPFTVMSDRTVVRAVGTQFDVYKRRGGTVVTVVEGRVAILTGEDAAGSAEPDPAASQPDAAARSSVTIPATGLVLAAGEQATVTADVATKTTRPSVASATAWTERQLIFESASLAEVAEEFNRYNTRRLVIEDDALDSPRISVVFSSTDPSSLVRFLRERGVAEVVETPAEIRIMKKVSNER